MSTLPVMRNITICLCLLLCASLCTAQGGDKNADAQSRPDLSGAWVLDKSKIDLSSSDSDLAQGGMTLIVLHREPEIKITRKFRSKKRDYVQEIVFYSDARGETNPVLIGKDRIKSRTAWEDKRLVSNSLWRSQTERGVREIKVINSWELSPDGKTLIQTVMYSRSRVINPEKAGFLVEGEPSVIRRFFNRAP
jgi:hypothetical protein